MMARRTHADIETDPATESDAGADASAEVGVSAVNRALSVLDSFTPESSTLSLAALSEKTGLYKSTILRLLQSLEAFGYIQRTGSGHYTLGPTPLRLAAILKSDLHPAEKIMPVLRQLMQGTGESATLYVRAGAMRLVAYRVDSTRSVRDNVHTGQLLPLHTGAAGKVLVDFERFDPAWMASPVNERPPLLRISLGERDPETAAMACPVFGVANQLEGAVSLSGPIGRFDPARVALMTPPLLEAARALTIALHGDPRLFVR
jgi:DNA-binding IclR family transcriptional regulator